MKYGLIGVQFDNVCVKLSKVTDRPKKLKDKKVTVHKFLDVQMQRNWISSVINQNSLELKNEPIWSRDTLSKLVNRLAPKHFFQIFKHVT